MHAFCIQFIGTSSSQTICIIFLTDPEPFYLHQVTHAISGYRVSYTDPWSTQKSQGHSVHIPHNSLLEMLKWTHNN